MGVTKETARLLEAARRDRPADEVRFGELHERALLEELNARQGRHDHERSLTGEALAALPKREILGCLEDLGWREGYDEAGSALFFGEEGTERSREGGLEGDEVSLGGFVFDAPDGAGYVLSCSALAGAGVEPASPPGGSFGGAFRRLVDRVARAAGAGASSRGWRRTRWFMARAGTYVVEPRFLYENVTCLDFFSGLGELYPIDDPERRVDRHEGTVSFRRSEEAIEFRARLEEALGARGILCNPRIVLSDGGFPILPRSAREERIERANERAAMTSPREEDLRLARDRSTFLDGHVVRRGLSALVPGQGEAESLAEKTGWLSVALERRDELARRLEDPRIPEERRRGLERCLAQAEANLEDALAPLDGQTEALCGLVLSLLCESRELRRFGGWRPEHAEEVRERNEERASDAPELSG